MPDIDSIKVLPRPEDTTDWSVINFGKNMPMVFVNGEPLEEWMRKIDELQEEVNYHQDRFLALRNHVLYPGNWKRVSRIVND